MYLLHATEMIIRLHLLKILNMNLKIRGERESLKDIGNNINTIIDRGGRMNLLNINVQHRSYGVGTIINQSENQITVRFATRDAKFQYPKCFYGFLTAVDPDIQSKIILDIQATAEKARQEAEAARIAEEEEKRIVEEEAQLAVLRIKQPSEKSPAHVVLSELSPRKPGQRWIYFVFQGSTFLLERKVAISGHRNLLKVAHIFITGIA